MAEEKRTQFAMAQVDLASMFNTYFQEGLPAGFGVRLTAPEGISSGKGIQSRQHLTLTDPSGKTQVVGSCNTLEKNTDLRPYDFVVRLYNQRHGGTFSFPRPEYEKLFQRFSDFFTSQGFTVKTTDTDSPTSLNLKSAKNKKSSSGLLILILLAAVLAGGLVWYFGFYR
jgi:hypothetical protein